MKPIPPAYDAVPAPTQYRASEILLEVHSCVLQSAPIALALHEKDMAIAEKDKTIDDLRAIIVDLRYCTSIFGAHIAKMATPDGFIFRWNAVEVRAARALKANTP